jgi:hypothetical protein
MAKKTDSATRPHEPKAKQTTPESPDAIGRKEFMQFSESVARAMTTLEDRIMRRVEARITCKAPEPKPFVAPKAKTKPPAVNGEDNED